MADPSRTLLTLARRMSPQVDALSRKVGPAARLARIDMRLFRAWASAVRPVRNALGEAEAEAFTTLLVATGEHDPEIARVAAFTVPEYLAKVPKAARTRYLRLLKAVIADRHQALPVVVRTLPALMERMDDETLVQYLSRGLALHAESSQKAESFFRMESNAGQREAERLDRGTTLADVRRRLTLYARAHCGADVQVLPAGAAGTTSRGKAFTDGRNIYLPDRVDRFDDGRDWLTYRVLTARNAGYIEFGTLNLDLDAVEGDWPLRQEGELEHERLSRSFANRSLAMDLFQLLERVRVEARVRDEYPGIGRDMDVLADEWREERPDIGTLAPAEQAVEWLQRKSLGLDEPALPDPRAAGAARQVVDVLDAVRGPGATVEDTVRAMQAAFGPIYELLRLAQPPGQPREPDNRDGPGGNQRQHGDGVGPDDPSMDNGGPDGPAEPDLLDYRPSTADALSGDLRTDMMSDGERSVEERARALLAAMRDQGEDGDLDQLRDKARSDESSYEEMAAFLERNQGPAGPAAERRPVPQRLLDELRPADGVELDGAFKPTQHLYPEWDHTIDDHKPRWVQVTEYHLKPGSGSFVEQVTREYGPLIERIRRSFEALRPDAMRKQRGVLDGDEIDIDRAIAARIEHRAGGSPDDRLYTRRNRDERDVAVAFLVDLSSSTNEVANAEGKRIIDVEREALVLIAEAVNAIGDACAIYGFSGYGREQVAFYVAKDFDDAWNDTVRERVGRMSWKMENRDGAAIRHATELLGRQRARVKLMLMLSDGKPLDCGCDHYSDRYAQEDTRVALNEARQQGIHPFCITVDPGGQDYLRRMYGDHGYTVIDRVDTLPQRLPQIYRRITR